MNRDGKVRLAAYGGGALVLVLLLGAIPVTAPLAWLPLAAFIFYAVRYVKQRNSQELPPPQYEPPPRPEATPPEPLSYTLSGVALDSALPGYRFLLSCVVHWYLPPTAPGALQVPHTGAAVNSILARAKEITKAASPLDRNTVQHQLTAALGTPQPDPSRQVMVWAEQVSLTTPDEETKQLRQLSELRRRELLWELERKHERRVRAYLEQEVLVSPSSAVVWWLARHLDRVDEAARLIGPLTQLSEVVNADPRFRTLVSDPNDGHLPSGFAERTVPFSPVMAAHTARSPETNGAMAHEPASALIRQLYPGAEQDSERALLGHQLAHVLSHHGAQEVAERIRQEFDAPDLTLAIENTPSGEPAPVQPQYTSRWPEETPGNHTSGHSHVPNTNNHYVPDRVLTGVAPDRNEGGTTPEEGPERRSNGHTAVQ